MQKKACDGADVLKGAHFLITLSVLSKCVPVRDCLAKLVRFPVVRVSKHLLVCV